MLAYEKLDLDIGAWLEDIQTAEVGEEGFFEVEGIRLFWKKTGTNPNDWEIVDVEQVDNISEEGFLLVEKRLSDFGFLNDPHIYRKMGVIKSSLNNYEPKNTGVFVPEHSPIQNPPSSFTQSLNKLSNFTKSAFVPVPIQTNIQTVNNQFFKQNNVVFKQAIREAVHADNSNDYSEWLLKINTDIYKQWMKTNKLITKLKRFR